MQCISEFLDSNMTRRKARAALLANGWQFVGGGSFAAVYGSPDGKTVAKVTKPDSGAEATYRVSRRLAGNPYLPRYYERLPLINGGAVYQVERLRPFHGWSDFEAAERRADGNSEYDAAFSELETEMGVNDCHYRNAMQREDGTLVMTDYVADMDELAHATANVASEAENAARYSRYGSNHWADCGKTPADAADDEDRALLEELLS